MRVEKVLLAEQPSYGRAKTTLASKTVAKKFLELVIKLFFVSLPSRFLLPSPHQLRVPFPPYTVTVTTH